MKRKSIKALAIITAFCVAFTSLPMLVGTIDVHAAAKTAKKIKLSATVTGQNAVVLKWKKIKRPGKGYAVFRDGKVIAKLGKKTSFTDSGLSAGTTYTYQIKAYKIKKVKKKVNGKKKKVKVYKYSKPSNKVSVRTKTASNTPNSQQSSDSTADNTGSNSGGNTDCDTGSSGPFPVDDKVTLTYSANNSSTKTTIYLGQTWTSTVKENLKRGSSGFATYTRNKFYVSITKGSAFDGTAYLYDIGDYDNFLKVDVANGQIVGWQTIASSMADSHGLAIRRGKYYEWTPSNSQQMDYVYADFCESNDLRSVTGLNYEVGGYIIGGVKGYTNVTDNSVLNMGGLRSNEKMIGFHYVNAARVHAGCNKIAYNNYLDGGSKTVTTTETIELHVVSVATGTSQHVVLSPGTYRYGAQPAAETVSANSPKHSHNFDTDGLNKGPLGGWEFSMRFRVMEIASGDTVDARGEILHGNDNDAPICTGEEFLFGFAGSEAHLNYIFGNYTQVGFGACRGSICEIYGK